MGAGAAVQSSILPDYEFGNTSEVDVYSDILPRPITEILKNLRKCILKSEHNGYFMHWELRKLSFSLIKSKNQSNQSVA